MFNSNNDHNGSLVLIKGRQKEKMTIKIGIELFYGMIAYASAGCFVAGLVIGIAIGGKVGKNESKRISDAG